MARLRTGRFLVSVIVLAGIIAIPLLAFGQKYRIFSSEEYGFSMKYPDTWVKIDNPPGNYYVVFQAPDKIEGYRNRIQVAAHRPVKDPTEVFLQEMRNGVKEMQKSSAGQKPEQLRVRIVDEGEFKCDVPGAYYFVIQAFEDKENIWLDIVVVFYKYDKTLLRVSCLAPPKSMERYHKIFNDVLVSVRFQPTSEATAEPPKPSPVPPPAPGTPSAAPRPERTTEAPAPATQPPAPMVRPGQPAAPAPGVAAPRTLSPAAPQVETVAPGTPTEPAPGGRPVPRGPLRQPTRPPSTGIVE